ncbi:aldose 1-epimerase family protein [Cellulomonas shaoxiangyii]|uniref:aldose 1-epimerase family protein n=1 Tax=Cellulomonas shaoxiangyii TaxID=2566013 RepID=UPI001FB6781C|nr:aldose 1-epimerase family protein [Cellulomonas shaoxiangyii]
MTSPYPTGDQHELRLGAQVAVITSVGASIREYRVGDRDVVLPFAAESLAPAFSGAVLAPWPNRIRDGVYAYRGTTYQLHLSEPPRGVAIHGLVAYARFDVVERSDDAVTLRHDLVPTPGYPWSLRIEQTYRLTDRGLDVTTVATNLGDDVAPYGVGYHPWLSPGPGTVDECTLQVDAARHVDVDNRLLPTVTEPVAGVFDLRQPKPLKGVQLDDAWVEPIRDADGLSWVRLTGSDGRTVAMWADATLPAWQVCTGDGLEGIQRGGVAAEPMSCIADAFRTGDLLVELEGGGTHEAHWGLGLI